MAEVRKDAGASPKRARRAAAVTSESVAGASDATTDRSEPRLPLSALLSQALLAYTVEFDNEFERATLEAGHPTGVSLVYWPAVVRPVADGPVPMDELARRSCTSVDSVLPIVGAAVRLGLLSLTPPGAATGPRGAGAGQGRMGRAALGANMVAALTDRGALAHELWAATSGSIESRWRKRFGAALIGGLRDALVAVADDIDQELPDFVDMSLANRPNLNRSAGVGTSRARYGPRVTKSAKGLPVWALLSRVLLWFRLEFDEARGPAEDLSASANLLRVLTAEGVSAGELHVRAGGSRESVNTAGVTRFGLAVEVKDPKGRGKLIKLTPAGAVSQEGYATLAADIEEGWRDRYGAPAVDKLRSSLESLFSVRDRSGRLRVVDGLVPPAGTLRDTGIWWGHTAPNTRPHYAQREHDCVAQSEAWVRDPVAALAHYPLWNPTRGLRP